MQGVTHLLRAVLDDGYELTETKMELLFSARGADFDAVCNAAGAKTLDLQSPFFSPSGS